MLFRSLTYADTHGIESFSELYPVYSKAVGIDAEMERARADERFDDYLNSPQAEEQRQKLRSMMNNQNEMEELEER